jgi:hypothetical protein
MAAGSGSESLLQVVMNTVLGPEEHLHGARVDDARQMLQDHALLQTVRE